MGLMDIFEPEELVGKAWDRLVGGQSSYPHFPEAAVRLKDVQGMLGVFFHGIGGDAGLEIAGAVSREQGHRLGFLMKLGTAKEQMELAHCDSETLFLPNAIDFFPARELNRKLYLWLAAYMVQARRVVPSHSVTDPLQRDVLALRHHAVATAQTLDALPGLRPVFETLADAIWGSRKRSNLPKVERQVEEVVGGILLGATPLDPTAWDFVVKGKGELDQFSAPVGYKPFLPVPLWGEVTEHALSRRLDGEADEDEEDLSDGSETQDLRDGRKFAAEREENPEAERDDPLILDRFEHILAMADMLNLNRPTDEDDKDPMRAADDLDVIKLSKNEKKTASKIHLDLDLPSDMVDPTGLLGEFTYPEWDYRKKLHHPDHCLVLTGTADEEGEDWSPDEAARKRIRKVRRQFEALRPKRESIPREFDGRELDIDALIRSRCDLAASGDGSDRVYTAIRNESRDLAALILVDVSLSTDAWMEGRRVLDVEKEALSTLTHGLAASGDDHAIYTFTSRRRSKVMVNRVKDFDEPLNAAVDRRIAALKPGYYTRMGAAIRFAADELNTRPNRHRLLLLISDGKPNDLDHYDGRYGIEDSRMAILEARKSGLAVYGVTVDAQARDYFPFMFGRGGCAIIPHINRLTAALPNIYRHLVM